MQIVSMELCPISAHQIYRLPIYKIVTACDLPTITTVSYIDLLRTSSSKLSIIKHEKDLTISSMANNKRRYLGNLLYMQIWAIL